MNRLKWFAVLAIATAASLAASAADISGAGATFPYPIYAKWADAYKKLTGIGLNYQSIGSGGGIKQIKAKTVTFGASDMPLKPEDLKAAGLLQFPMIIGGVVPVVNVKGIAPGQLHLDGATVASIYLGEITEWDVLEEELAKTGDAPSYFKDLITRNLIKFDMAAILPASVTKWVKDEASVVRVSTLLGDVGDLRKSLDESEDVVRRLEKALNGPARVNVFPELAAVRTKSVEYANQLTEVKRQLAVKESQLIGPVAGPEKSTLDQFDRERQALEAKLSSLPTRADSIVDRQRKARAAFNEVDKHAVELITRLRGMRDSLAAAKRMHEKSLKTMPQPEPVKPEVQLPPPTPPAAYAAKLAELDGRLNQLKGQIESAVPRMDTVKDHVIKGTAQKPELDAIGGELDALQTSVESVRKDLEDAASGVGVDDADMQAARRAARAVRRRPAAAARSRRARALAAVGGRSRQGRADRVDPRSRARRREQGRRLQRAHRRRCSTCG